MIDVHFFASLREKLSQDSVHLSWSADTASVRSLIAVLVQQQGAAWRQILQDEQVLVAVNQEVANFDAALVDGDEVAFFPPVTGG